MMRTLKLWILAILVALGALIAPSPVVPDSFAEEAKEVRITKTQHLPEWQVAENNPEPPAPKPWRALRAPTESSYVSGRAEVLALPEFTVDEFGFIDSSATRVAADWTLWIDTWANVRVYEAGFGARPAPNQVTVTRRATAEATVDLSHSDVLWSQTRVAEPMGFPEKPWPGPSPEEVVSGRFWRVTSITEWAHPGRAPAKIVPERRRGQQLWEFNTPGTATKVFVPYSAIGAGRGDDKSTKGDIKRDVVLAWLRGDAVARQKEFVDAAGLPAVAISFDDEGYLALVNLGASAYYPRIRTTSLPTRKGQSALSRESVGGPARGAGRQYQFMRIWMFLDLRRAPDRDAPQAETSSALVSTPR